MTKITKVTLLVWMGPTPSVVSDQSLTEVPVLFRKQGHSCCEQTVAVSRQSLLVDSRCRIVTGGVLVSSRRLTVTPAPFEQVLDFELPPTVFTDDADSDESAELSDSYLTAPGE